MANRQQKLLLEVQTILDKAQMQRERDEIANLLKDVTVNIDLDSKEFEDAVRKVFDNMSKEAMTAIGNGFNKAFELLGKKPIDMGKLIQMPNDKMWEELGERAGNLIGKGLSKAIRQAVNNAGTPVTNNAGPVIVDTKAASKEVEELRKLIKKKHELEAEEEKYNKKVRIKNQAREKVFGKEFKDQYDEKNKGKYVPEKAAIDANFRAQARAAVNDFASTNKELENAIKENKVTATLLEKWMKGSNNLDKYYRAIEDKDDRKTQGNALEHFDEETYNFMFDEKHGRNPIQLAGYAYIEEFFDADEFADEADRIKQKVAEIDVSISKLVDKYPELISEKVALEAEQRLKRVHEVVNKLNTGAPNQKERVATSLRETLDYSGLGHQVRTVGKVKDLDEHNQEIERDMNDKEAENVRKTQREVLARLKLSHTKYEDSTRSWLQRSISLIEFVKEYESVLNNPQADKNILDRYKVKYEELKALAQAAEEDFKQILSGIGHEYVPQTKKSEDASKTKESEDTPWFTDLSKYKEAANEKNALGKEAVDNAQQEVAAQQAITAEMQKQKKILPKLIHIGYFDGYEEKDFANSDRMGQAPFQTNGDYGIFGDGIFTVTVDNWDAVLDLMQKYGALRLDGNEKGPYGDGKRKSQIYTIDPNDYNFYVNETKEEAENSGSILHAMQKFLFAKAGVEFDEPLSDKLTINGVYKHLKEFIKGFSWTFEEFNVWAEKQIAEIKQHTWVNDPDHESDFGYFNTDDKDFLNSHNLVSRFMMAQGYGGIYNKTGDVEFDGFKWGSVLYEPKFDKIKDSKSFDNFADFLLSLGKTAEEANVIIDNVNQKIKQYYLDDQDELVMALAQKAGIEHKGIREEDIPRFMKVGEQPVETHREVAEIQKKIETYEGLCNILERLNEIRAKSRQTGDEVNEEYNILERLNNTKGKSEPGKEVSDMAQWGEMLSGNEPVGVKEMAQFLGIEIPNAAAKAEQSVEEVTDSFEKQQQVNNVQGGTINAEEQKQLQNLEEAVNKITTAVDLKTQAFNNEGTAVDTVVNTGLTKLGELETKVIAIKTSLDELLTGINGGNIEAVDQYINKFKELGEALSLTKSQLSSLDEVTKQTLSPILSQIASIKRAVDMVSKAIGRQNAGFIKGAKAVNESFDSEKQNITELANYINSLINNTLNDLRYINEQFVASFNIPEVDNGKLQAHFDEIYQKFIELKSKIDVFQFDIGVNTEAITEAIQKALYSKEIMQDYKQMSFFNAFQLDPNDNTNLVDQLTGEVLEFEEASKRYNEEYKKLYVSRNFADDTGVMSYEAFELEEVINKVASKRDSETLTQQNNWAQIIVKELRDQGNKIFEAIKVILPESILNSTQESTLTEAFDKLANAIQEAVKMSKLYDSPRDVFEALKDGIITPEQLNINDAMRTLGLIDDSGKIKFKVASVGGVNSGVALGEEYVYHTTREDYGTDIEDFMRRQEEAYKMGAAIPKILSMKELDGMIYTLQERAPGANLRSPREVDGEYVGGTVADDRAVFATEEQIDKLINTFKILEKVGLYPEFGGDNVLYDEKKGFTMIDLDADPNKYWASAGSANEMVNGFLSQFRSYAPYFDEFKDHFMQRVEALMPEYFQQDIKDSPKILRKKEPVSLGDDFTNKLLNAGTETLAKMVEDIEIDPKDFESTTFKTKEIRPTEYPNIQEVISEDGEVKYIRKKIETYEELYEVISKLNGAYDVENAGGELDVLDREVERALVDQFTDNVNINDLFTSNNGIEHLDVDQVAKAMGIAKPKRTEFSNVDLIEHQDGSVEYIKKEITTYEELCEVVAKLNNELDKLDEGQFLYGAAEAARDALGEQIPEGISGRMDDGWGHFDVDKIANKIGIEIPKILDSFSDSVNPYFDEFGNSISHTTQVEIEKASEQAEDIFDGLSSTFFDPFTTKKETEAQEQLNTELQETVTLKEKLETIGDNGTPGKSVEENYLDMFDDIDLNGELTRMFKECIEREMPNIDGFSQDVFQSILDDINAGVFDSLGDIISAFYERLDKLKYVDDIDDEELFLNNIFDDKEEIFGDQNEVGDKTSQILQDILNATREITKDETLRLICEKIDKIRFYGGQSTDINPHLVTDPTGKVVDMYRGIHGAYSGIVSNRYHDGTFFTDNIELAKEYAGALGKIEKVHLSMKNPLEIDGHGANWNEIEYIGNGADDVSKKLHYFREGIQYINNKIPKLEEELKNLNPPQAMLANYTSQEEKEEAISLWIKVENSRIKKEISELENQKQRYQEAMQSYFDSDDNPYMRGTTNQIVEMAKANGYDGVIFRNIVDSATGKIKEASNIMVTFEQDQIHYIETIKASFSSAIEAIKNTLVDGVDIKDYLQLTQEDVKIYVDQLSSALSGFKLENASLFDSWKASEYGSEEYKSLYRQIANKITESLSQTPDLQKFYTQFINKTGLNFSYLTDGEDLDEYSEYVYHYVELLQNKMRDVQKTFNTTATSVEEYEREHPEVSESDIPNEQETIKQIVGAAVEAIKANTGNVETKADDSILTAIKNAVESINKKIVQGTKVLRVGGNKKAKEKSKDLEIKNPKELGDVKAKKVDPRLKDLRALYVEQGTLEVHKEEAAAAIRLGQIEKDILSLKQQGVALDEEEINNIKAKAKHNEENRLIVEKAKEDAKKAAQDEKAALKAEMKSIRDKSRVTKAVSTWRSGKDVHGLTMNMVDESQGISIDDVINHPEIAKLYDELDNLTQVQEKVNNQINNHKAVSEEDAIALQKQTAATQQQINVVKDLQKNYEFFSGDNSSSLGQMYTGGNLETQLKQAIILATNGKARFHEYDTTLQRWSYSVKGANNETKYYTGGLRELDGQLRAVHTSTKKTESLFESIKRKTKEVFAYFTGSSMIYKAFNQLRQGIQYIREIDVALTELKKVTDATDETYDKFLDTAAKTASKVGSTMKEVVSSTADFARLGYTLEEAAVFAESAQILMNVSEFTDISRATDTLISAVQAFGYTAETSLDVVDLLNKIGNNYAISTADLAQSLTKSSAALVAAGGNLAEAAALTATANKMVQDADSVGTALKTTSLRLRGTSVDILNEEGVDSEGAVTSKSKLQSKVKALSGVDILTATGEYKSTYEILSQIADVWEDINDMDQAALLELISGKRNASVIAAILQNPKELKEAFEDANNAEGSALRENEKYLDSIQGRIDLLTSAMQTMWKNTLNSDWVKFFVDLLTSIVKLVDKLGLIPSLLITISTISMVKNKMGPLEFFTNLFSSLQKAPGKIKDFAKSFVSVPTAASKAAKAIEDLSVTVSSFQESMAGAGLDSKQQKSVLSQLGLDGANSDFKLNKKQINADNLTSLANNGTLNKTQVDQLASVYGLKDAYKELSAEQMNNVLTNMKLDESQKQNIINTLGLNNGSKLLTQNNIEQAFASNGLATAQGTQAAAGVGLTATNTGLAASFTALWAAMWPVLLLMGGILAIVGIVKIFDALITTSAELEDQLSDLQSEMSDLESEIDSINSELEATRERMEELLAMPSLSFTEEEELRNLQTQTAELERQLELKEELKKAKQEEITNTAEDLIDKSWNDGSNFDVKSGRIDEYDKANGDSAPDTIDAAIKKYQSSSGEQKEKFKTGIDNIIGHYADLISENNLTYGMSDDIDAFLDEFYANNYKWQKAQGKMNKSDLFGKILSDDTNNGISSLKEKVSEVMNDEDLTDTQKQVKVQEIVQNALNDTTGMYDRLQTSMSTIGLTANELTGYFVKMSKAPDSDTIEGITEQYAMGVNALQKYSGYASDIIGTFTDVDGTVEQITWGSLFDKDGNTIDTQIAKLLQGADEDTRKGFAKIAKSVNEGKITVEQAIASFSASGVVAGWKIIETQVSELNTEVFKDLGDEISGIIDTVSELSSAFESVADSIDLVNQAQAEMAYSGHLSVETALKLMESTDDWNKILKIEEGNIKLVDGAEENLVQTKLDLIKTNLQTTLATLKAQLAQLTATETNLDAATTIEESTNVAVQNLAGNMAYAARMAEAYTRAMAGEEINIQDFINQANADKQDVLDKTNYKKNAAESMGREKIEEQIAETQALLDMLDTVDTTSEFKSNYSSDKVSGGNRTKEDAEKARVEEKLDEYERRLALITNERDLIEAEIDKMEARGGKASAQYYEDLIRNSNEEKALLEEKQKYLEEYLATNKDNIDPETWAEYNDELNETAVAIKECEINTIEWTEAIREIDLYYFEQTTEAISQLGEELEFINSLLEDEDVADQNGNWSDAGLTRIGLYTQQMEKAAVETQRAKDELAELQSTTSEVDKNTDWYREREEELTQAIYDGVDSYNDAKDGIVELNEARIDAIKEGIEEEIEAYEDYIDVVKEALDAERDLYDFKKDVKKQTKDITALERRIAALSSSTNASDIAERRKLEAELLEAKEGLNDTYYDHSRDQQSQALDNEAEAFSKSKEKYIEELEATLDDVETLITNSIMEVMTNADTVLAQLNELSDTYGITLSAELTQPWVDAAAKPTEYWQNAQNAISNYADFLTGDELGNRFSNTITRFGQQIQTIIDKWNRVEEAANDAYTAQTRTTEVGGVVKTAGTNNTSKEETKEETKTETKTSLQYVGVSESRKVLGSQAFVDKNTHTINGVKYYKDVGGTEHYVKLSDLVSTRYDGGRSQGYAMPKGVSMYRKYAKGTLGTSSDEWAITDEPWFGDELVMVPTAQGNLSFMRKGTSVVPADITANLVEWGKLNPDMLKVGDGANINMISNAVIKPELNFEFDSLVHVDNCSQETLKDLEKMVDNKINQFNKQLNYSLKKFTR